MKRALMIIGLGIAFVGASLWVMLSGGRSAKAIRAKFRLGGAILTLVSYLLLREPHLLAKKGEDAGIEILSEI